MVRRLVLIVALLSSTIPAWGQAANVYMTQTGSIVGNCTGTPRYSVAQVNTSSNWGTGGTQIGPGTTVLMCGTFTTGLIIQGDGTLASPIIFRSDSSSGAPALFQSPAWSWGSGAVSTNGHQYLVFDGNNRAGTMQNTANGTIGAACVGGPCSVQQAASTLFQLGPNTSASNGNIEIEFWVLDDVYVRNQNDVWIGCPASCANNTQNNAIYVGGNGSSGPVKIHDNIIHDVSWAINVGANGAANGIQIYNNDIYNFDHGYANGLNVTSGTAAMNHVRFYGNHVHDPANWDDPSNMNHHDGIHFYANPGPSTGTMTANDVQVYSNLFDGNWGAHPTAEQFCQFGTSGNGTVNTSNFAWFNNVFYGGGFAAVSNGLFTCVMDGTGNSFYNNTLIGNSSLSQFYCFSPQSLGSSGFKWNAQNNVFAYCPVGFFYEPGNTVGIGNWDHNIYQASGTTYWVWAGTNYTTFAAFQAACGCETTGSSSQSVVDVSTIDQIIAPIIGTPNTSSAVKGAGTNLTSLGITALDSDTSAGNNRTPVARPPTGTWDIGAYQLSPLAPFVPIMRPLNLILSVH